MKKILKIKLLIKGLDNVPDIKVIVQHGMCVGHVYYHTHTHLEVSETESVFPLKGHPG